MSPLYTDSYHVAVGSWQLAFSNVDACVFSLSTTMCAAVASAPSTPSCPPVGAPY